MKEERAGFPDILSSQRSISFPLPGVRYSCCLNLSIPILPEFHIVVPKGVLDEVIFLKDPPLRYFILKILLTGWCLFTWSCQISLLLCARLAWHGSRICKPHSDKGLLIISQLVKCILFRLPFPPFHRKSRNNLEIWTEIDLGANNNEDWNNRRAERIDLIKTNFPALFS